MGDLKKASDNSVPLVWITLSSEHFLVEGLGEETPLSDSAGIWPLPGSLRKNIMVDRLTVV